MTSPPSADVPRAGGDAPTGAAAAAFAAMFAAAIAAGEAAAMERHELPFGANGVAGWSALGGIALVALWFARAQVGRGRAMCAAAAALAIAAAAALQLLPSGTAALAPLFTLLPAAVAVGAVAGLGAATPVCALRAALAARFVAAAAGALLGAAIAPRLPFAGNGAATLVAVFAALLFVARRDAASMPRSRGVRAAVRAFASALTLIVFVAGAPFVIDVVAPLGAPLPAAGVRVLGTAGGHAAVYVRATQELRLYDGGRLVDAAGPDRAAAPFAATLLRALLQPGDRVLVLGIGAGRLYAALQRSPRFVADAVDWRPRADTLRVALAADGPVAPPAGARAAAARCSSFVRALAALDGGARQAIVLAESATAAAQRTPDGQRELRRVAGDGLVLQVIALDGTPALELHELFAAAAAAHAWNGLFVIGDDAVLVCAGAPPDFAALAPFAAWSDDERWNAHAAHVGGPHDLQLTLLGALDGARAPLPKFAGTSRADALAVVRAWLQPAADPRSRVAVGGPAVFAKWQALRAELRAAVGRVRAAAKGAEAAARAQADAVRFLPVGAPAAELQAALALPGADGETLLSPSLAARRAHAIDPAFFADAPRLFAAMERPVHAAGALEDLAALPAAPRLAELCAGDDPAAIALRARFPSPCARALVEQLASAPLPAPAMCALRELADAFVLTEAANVLAARGALREVLGLWRIDLPSPPAVAALLEGRSEERRALAAALRGRRDPDCHPLLAALLEDEDVEVLCLAGEALAGAVGDRVPFDADWPLSARREAAARLRALHNRAP